EIERASSRFQLNAEGLDDEALEKLSEGYREWKARAASPGLIKNVFAARKVDGELGSLMRLDETTGRFQPVDWPPEVSALRSRFSSREGFFNGEAKEWLGTVIEHGYVAEDVPAIVRVIIDLKRGLKREEGFNSPFRERGEEPGREPLRESGIAIIDMDLKYI